MVMNFEFSQNQKEQIPITPTNSTNKLLKLPHISSPHHSAFPRQHQLPNFILSLNIIVIRLLELQRLSPHLLIISLINPPTTPPRDSPVQYSLAAIPNGEYQHLTTHQQSIVATTTPPPTSPHHNTRHHRDPATSQYCIPNSKQH